MGRAINQDNRLDDHEKRIKLMEDALEEMIQTRVHHIDLTDDVESTPPVSKRKKTKNLKDTAVA